MYCTNCRTQISENARFCPVCGKEILQTPHNVVSPFNMRGFSPRINDPAFAKYIKRNNRYSIIISIILAVVAIIGFYIAGEMGSEGMSNPASLFIGFGIGGMFLFIALFQISRRKFSSTWDGIVENKKIKKKTHHDQDSVEKYLEYSIIVRSDLGKKYVIKTRSSDIYNYYNIGNRVRHHAGLNSLEKYDNTGDMYIPCNACGTLCNIRDDVCYNCKCPLLK